MRNLLATVLCIGVCVSANAQETSVPFGGFQHDANQPVEISADSLNIDQGTGQATFAGGVQVGQGDLRMSADRIDVFYASSGGQIDRLQASGKVTLTNGVEAAEANEATYSVASGEVLMQGAVLLTQGPNALSGENLVIDLATGQARMQGRVKTILQTQETAQ